MGGRSVTQTAKDAYGLYKKVKKARDYGELVKKSLDEDTRDGALFKMGIKAAIDLAGKALGTSLSSHPYFTYHKAHIEALVQALDASSTQDSARQALDSAVRSADYSVVLSSQVDGLVQRQKTLKLNYTMWVAGGLSLARESKTSSPSAAAQMRDAGLTADTLSAANDDAVYVWRAQVCELWSDGLKLMAMVDVEYKATWEAMNRYDQKMKKLVEGKSTIGFVAGKAAEQERQLMQIERENDQIWGRSKASPQAVEDPVKFAERQLMKVEDVTRVLATNADLAMSDAAYDPQAINVGYR